MDVIAWHRVRHTVQMLERVTECTGRYISGLSLLLVMVVFLVVVLRYGFSMGSIALQELAVYFHATLFLGGSAYTLKHHGHVRVDIFYRRMTATRQAWVNLLGTVFFLFPVCLSIAGLSWGYVTQSWAVMESSQDPGGLPFVYLLKSLLLVLVMTLLVQGIADVLKSVQQLFDNREHSNG